MGWFSKSLEDKKKERNPILELPELPKLPELPGREEIPIIKKAPPNHFPSFSTKSLEKRITHHAIKEAVSGEKEGDEKHANELGKPPMMHVSPRKKMTREIEEGEGWEIPSEHPHIPEEFHEAAKKVQEAEPVFVRIDKFQESLNTFEKIQREVQEIERKLKDIKKIKEQEETELHNWQEEIATIKEQIDKIDRDVFSKVD